MPEAFAVERQIQTASGGIACGITDGHGVTGAAVSQRSEDLCRNSQLPGAIPQYCAAENIAAYSEGDGLTLLDIRGGCRTAPD